MWEVYELKTAIQKVQTILHVADATNLLLGTAAQESHLGEYLEQIGGGPGRGVFQIEPATEKDVWANFLRYRPDLSLRVIKALQLNGMPYQQNVTTNIYYAIAIARLIYLRAPQKLPAMNDVPGLARYWKQYYNTPSGAGTEQQFIENYKRYID